MLKELLVTYNDEQTSKEGAQPLSQKKEGQEATSDDAITAQSITAKSILRPRLQLARC